MYKILMVPALAICFSAVPMLGQSSDAIRDTQQVLKNKGLYDGPVDGIYGRKTRLAVRSYQEKQNLNVDGRLDPQTLDSLGVKHGTAGTEFHAAGTNVKHSYANGGKEIAQGSKEFGSGIKHGDVLGAGKDLGKGIGKGAGQIGVGTGHAAKNAAKGVKTGITNDTGSHDTNK
jgi:peptidoglycan hydrolase-like protein with peptidoglycan-binding domain